MSKATEQAAPLPDHLADLRKWLNERGLTIVPVAVGVRSGQPSPIVDFIGNNHVADWVLIPRDNGANNSGGG